MRGLAVTAVLFFVVSAAAQADRIKITLPAHIQAGKSLEITLTGTAPKVGGASLELNAQVQLCASTVAKVPSTVEGTDIAVASHRVYGQFTYRNEYTAGELSFLRSPGYFCAYLSVAAKPGSYVTTAHASHPYRIAS